MKKRQNKLALLLCTALSLSMLGSCGQKKEEVEKITEDVAIVEASNPTIGELSLKGEFIATISPDDSVYIIPKATAEVVEVKVSAGDVVEAGDVLAVLAKETDCKISSSNAVCL